MPHPDSPSVRRSFGLPCGALIAVLALSGTGPAAADEHVYDLLISADFAASQPGDCVPVTASVDQERHLLRELSWDAMDTMADPEADGELALSSGRWTWNVPRSGGALRYCLTVDERSGDRYVARFEKDWVVMRGDDLFPAVRSRTLKGAHSKTRLAFELPGKWSSVTRFPETEEDHVYAVSDPDRRLDRPTGWLALGRIGVRRDTISGISVAVAGPVDQGVRRLDLLTLLSYSLPTLGAWFDRVPERLLLVSARDRMWRGALSGPGSLYFHASRPMVSENGTSPLLHELVHVAMQRVAAPNEDWIDEGLAEYLGLLLLYESGGITRARLRDAVDWQAEWAREAAGLGRRSSTGPETALAVGIFADLHEELGKKGFRQFVADVSSPGPALTLERLREHAEAVHGEPVESLPERDE